MARSVSYGPWLAGLVLAASGGALWFFYPRGAPAPAPATAAPPPALATAPEAVPEVRHPIEQVAVPPAESAEPLPALADSDAAALAALGALMAGTDPSNWLVPQFLVQRLVTTIDNLPKASMPRQVYAAQPVAGTLAVAQADGRRWLDAANYARYDTAVAVFEGADSRQLVAAYVRFYPLFQQAWAELGTGGQFNDRLVQVIDHLLAAPEIAGPIELVPAADGRPRLAFADPRLEGASVGHKAMLRIGPDHAARVKTKLRQLRDLLAGQRPAG
ncbi:DUF3014 domain-containing protein [Arenimonas terrae]|uniref:DUF3014 domain-containing protein n=1 Tax=Arenimonas terrae TaxID=2546226 RepID=A0A5C4RX37_9GAMM|nr:DUF3014 domain-containing protein [Arenimonas terrae]TNJ35634.1 DUF3014 domain-containing protein [Arenimonas terrae]